MKNEKLICLLCAAVILTYSTTAKDKVKGHGEHGNGHSQAAQAAAEEPKEAAKSSKSDEKVAKVTITSGERETIRNYVSSYNGPGRGHGKNKGLPPGLAKKGGNLPPGWEKKVNPGQVMPVDVYKECKPLPSELSIKLPSPPKGVVTVVLEGKAVRLLEATREILDVFDIFSK